MTADDDGQAELLRRFESAVTGAELTDLRQLTNDLAGFAGRRPEPLVRPELRRAPRDGVWIYRIRADLENAQPPIWRRVDLHSDLSLDIVHQVLQAAFDWTDSYLHRFTLGGRAFDHDSQLFLCPYDIENDDWDESDECVPAAGVRLDEAMREPGDVLYYLYDYGDMWELTLLLEAVLPAPSDSPTATVVDGRRAAPPEDCGGLTDAESLSEVLEDASRFELDDINQALRRPYFILREHGVDQRLVELVHRLHYTRVADDLDHRTISMITLPTTLESSDTTASLRAHRWFLDRAAQGGIKLTTAGYLKPADVEAASKVIPAMGDWIGKNNREIQSAPVLHFRQTLQSTGLLRKHKGQLLLTRTGAAAQRDPTALWKHLAAQLVPSKDDTFDCHATLILLAYAATSANAELPLDRVAAALSELGWRRGDGRPVTGSALYRLPAVDVLINVSAKPAPRATARDECGGSHIGAVSASSGQRKLADSRSAQLLSSVSVR